MYPTPEYPQKGIFCHEQVKALKSLGVDVDVAVPVPFYSKEPDRREWDYEGVHIRYVRFFKLPGARDFQRTGKNLFPALDRAFDLKKYDIYHADAALPTGQAAMIAGKKYGKPYVVHGHGLDVFLEESYSGCRNVGKIVAGSAAVYGSAAAVCGVSRKVIERICEKVELSDRGHVIYNGVDTEMFRPASHEPDGTLHLISVGNLIPLKCHDMTLRALKALLDKGYPADLKIVGGGALENELKALAAELGIEDSVEFTGYVPYDDVRRMMQSSDVFVLPSRFEALGCVYLEAMACGLPAIGCYENGIDEVITDGVNGMLIENRNTEQLIEKLELLTDRSRRGPMGAEARKLMLKYSWENSAKKLVSIYTKLIR